MQNQVNLIGNVGGEVTLRTIEQHNTQVAEFSLATSKSWKDAKGEKQEKTQWHSIVVWGKKAEIAKKYIKKGSQVAITGEIEYNSYENKEGQRVNLCKINTTELTLLGKKE